MSWHFLQGRAEASWEDSCLDGAPSALLSLIPTAEASCSPGNATDCSHRSRSGTTSERLTASLGETTLMLFPVASHVRASQSRAKAMALEILEALSGLTWQGSLMKLNLRSSSWRTARSSPDEDLGLSSMILPYSGMMLRGAVWEPSTVVLPTVDTASGCWPTVTTSFNNRRPRSKPFRSIGLETAARLWLTPTQHGNYNRREASKRSGNGLATEMRLYGTPTASQETVRGRMAHRSRPGGLLASVQKQEQLWGTPTAPPRTHTPRRVDHGVQLANQVGGSLNPAWVEWLMGWPVGWTGLRRLGMGRFRSWLRSHGICS